MNENIIGIGIVVLTVVGLAAIYFWTKWRNAQKVSHYPTVWLTMGEDPPAGMEVAMETIRANLLKPLDRWAGVIEWVKNPYPYTIDPKRLAAGTVEDYAIPHIKVALLTGHVWETALTHEIGHLMWMKVYGSSGEGLPEFQRWVNTVNSEIRVRLTTPPQA